MIFIFLVAQTMQKAAAVKVLVVRDNADSRSEEETSDSLTSEESEELDFLMDLIQNESQERETPPVTTVKVLKRKPDVELFAQHSLRKEKVESQPKAFKEYHIHYHNHQHKEPPKLHMALEGDKIRPVLWDPQLSLVDYDSFKQLKKSSSVPYSEKARVKSFKDFESFLKSNLRSAPPSTQEYDSSLSIEAFKDFDAFIKPKIAYLKLQERTPFERFKTFQEFMDSEEEVSGKEKVENNKSSFPNEDRFAGFKDFSEIEDPNPKPQNDEDSSESEEENESLKIKDFAIVIKSKDKAHLKNKENPESKYVNKSKNRRPAPQIPPFVNTLGVPHEKFFRLPRVLEAAGGAPKYIERLNQMRRPHAERINYKNHIDFNSLENNEKQLFQLRPLPSHLLPSLPFKTPVNGWILRRLT